MPYRIQGVFKDLAETDIIYIDKRKTFYFSIKTIIKKFFKILDPIEQFVL